MYERMTAPLEALTVTSFKTLEAGLLYRFALSKAKLGFTLSRGVNGTW